MLGTAPPGVRKICASLLTLSASLNLPCVLICSSWRSSVVSEFEMAQNASMSHWSFEKVDEKLKIIMKQICKPVALTAKDYGVEGNYVDEQILRALKKLQML